MGCYYTHDSIRLSDNKTKLKKGDKEAFKLINKEEKKFEPSILIAGGIYSGGLTGWIINEGTLNEFAYAQVLLFYKDSYKELKSYRKIIRENSLIQNPPNYPDLAYPNEYIWAYIKLRIKRRNPQTLEELKKFILEEWNEISKKIIDNCGKKLQKKIRKSNRIRRWKTWTFPSPGNKKRIK